MGLRDLKLKFGYRTLMCFEVSLEIGINIISANPYKWDHRQLFL
jgi:hypothetical protein